MIFLTLALSEDDTFLACPRKASKRRTAYELLPVFLLFAWWEPSEIPFSQFPFPTHALFGKQRRVVQKAMLMRIFAVLKTIFQSELFSIP